MLSLKTLLPDIPENKLRELEIITQRIVDTGYAEIILLFGSYARGDFKLETDPRQPNKSDFDLLVVTLDEESKEKIEAEFRSGARMYDGIDTVVQLIVEQIERVNLALQSNQYFYTDIKNEGKKLHDSGRVSLSKALPISKVKRLAKAEHNLAYLIQEVKDFITVAEMCSEKSLYRKASFNYQQAAEFLYKTVEMVFADYQPYEHYLKTLRERANKFDGRMEGPFPLDTEEQQFLFDHLDLAYIGSRYIEETLYSVTMEQLEYWKTEVEKLLAVTEIVCNEKIEKLRKLI